MNIIEKMEKYNLTLRHLSSQEVVSTMARESEYNSPNTYDVIFNKERTKEQYDEECKKGWHTGHKFIPYKDDKNKGLVVCRMIKKVIEREEGWLVKIDNTHGSNQRWNRNSTWL